ncbi:MAG: CHAT domain-containing protein [Micropruina sp.]|uniref:CHAT domain-containing protein n=1 Tax=Micropruina sp. TaxID=2737536 RepID=UPI0039E5D375
MTPDTLDRLRRAWITQVAESAFPPEWASRLPELSERGPITRCTVVLGVGVGHLLGVDTADLVFADQLDTRQVVQLINHAWRGGELSPDLAAWLLPSLQSMLWAARRYEEWDGSPLGAWFAGSHLQQRIAETWGEGWAPTRDFEVGISTLCAEAPDGLSMDELYAWLCRESASSFLWSLTPLEARLLGADPERDAARMRLECARADRYVWLSVPGAWPEHPGDVPPAWLRDTVATEGARFWRASAGYVLTLTAIVETDRDERSLRRWCYAPSFGIRFPSDSSVDLFIVLDPEEDPAYLPFHFSYDDHRTAQQLDVLIEVGIVRIEFYRLIEEGDLLHLWNFGVPTTDLTILRDHRDQWVGEAPARIDPAPAAADLIAMIDQRQRALFDSTLPSIDTRSAAPAVAAAWERRLQVLEDAARRHAFGSPLDQELLSESATELRLAEAGVHRVPLHSNPEVLASGEALLHFSVEEQSRWFSAVVVYRGGNGTLDGQVLDLEIVYPAPDRATVTGALVQLLTPLRVLLDRGITDLLISAGLGAYDLPLHDAALALGFRTASYSHSLRLHRRSSLSTGDLTGGVIGYAGSGGSHLAAAAAELEIVRAITDAVVMADWRGSWPRLVHVAGHGVTGSREYESGILLDDDLLSAPGILRSVDASATELTFLSACDSGAGVFRPGQVGRSVPLDVALMEKGCRAVISTSAPVNDQVALIFATAFHHWFASGLSAWDSYRHARAVFSDQRIRVPSDIAVRLDKGFPAWRGSVHPSDRDGWRLFRFSGDRTI